ncbi:hypothetical protein KFU94_43420 [Chloroflexi bacterium TSY]|nr:hypothetical protein [Chloroflexi bacterium TSY]
MGKQQQSSHQQRARPPLRTPLCGLAARIADSILIRRALTEAHVQELELPCEEGLATATLEKQRKSRRETARQYVVKLFHHGYIRRVPLPSHCVGRPSYLYGAPTWKAVKEVAAYHHRELTAYYGIHIPEDMEWKTKPKTLAAGYGYSRTDKILTTVNSSSGYIRHFLKELDVNVIITVACRRHGYQLVQWDSDLQLRRRHQDVTISYTSPVTEAQVDTAVIPDGWYALENKESGDKVSFFIELDLGTQPIYATSSSRKRPRDWHHKFAAVKEFFEGGYFAKHYGEDTLAMVVLITTSPLWMRRLQHVCEEVGGSNFLFTYFDIFTPKNVLTQPIFQRAGDRTWMRLFEAYEVLQQQKQCRTSYIPHASRKVWE